MGEVYILLPSPGTVDGTWWSKLLDIWQTLKTFKEWNSDNLSQKAEKGIRFKQSNQWRQFKECTYMGKKKKGRPIEVGIHVKGDLDLRATMNAVFALF